MKIRSVFFLIFFFHACVGKKTEYLYLDTTLQREQDEQIYSLDILKTDKKIDILLVVDNSLSMDTIHDNVVINANLFFEQFARQGYVDWKLGIISTDKSQRPFLGFDSDFSAKLIYDTKSFKSTIKTFQDAVSSLGTEGDLDEYVFYNIGRILELYNDKTIIDQPPFLRERTHLAIIMVTDEVEQSRAFGPEYEAEEFLRGLYNYVDDGKIVRFYGALGMKGLTNCSNYLYKNYKRSQFEKIIDLSGGFAISACIRNFGNELARIGKDIVSILGLPDLVLKRRPVAETLEIYYRGELLPPGRREDGGFWYYEEESNTINFYNIDFIENVKDDYLRIAFDVDDGIDRHEE